MTIRGVLGGLAALILAVFMATVIVSILSIFCARKPYEGTVATSLVISSSKIREGIRQEALRSRSGIQERTLSCPKTLVCAKPQGTSEPVVDVSSQAPRQEASGGSAIRRAPLGQAHQASVRADSGAVLRTTQETARCLFYLQAARNAKEAWQTCAVSRGPRSSEQTRARAALCTLQYGARTISLCAPAQRRATILTAPDFAYLKALAISSGLDWRVVVAVAWEETRDNVNPWVRGSMCWNETIRDPECDAGRFQVRVSTARVRCPGKNIFTYSGNLACFAMMFAEDTRIGGTLSAIRRHNGSGRQADEYVTRVLRIVGWLTVMEEGS